jgi:hypothetical protein
MDIDTIAERIKRHIDMLSWREHLKAAKDMNMVMSGSGNEHLNTANEIARSLRLDKDNSDRKNQDQ